MVILLLVLETSLSTHLAFALGKLPSLAVLMVSTHRPVTKIFGLTSLISMRLNHCQSSISTQDVSLQQTVCSILVLPELMLLFVHGISSWPLLLLLFHRWHTAFQHVSGLTVNSFWDFTLCAAGIVGHFIEAQRPLHTRHSSQVADVLLFSVFGGHKTI